jgi:hypothetical protein
VADENEAQKQDLPGITTALSGQHSPASIVARYYYNALSSRWITSSPGAGSTGIISRYTIFNRPFGNLQRGLMSVRQRSAPKPAAQNKPVARSFAPLAQPTQPITYTPEDLFEEETPSSFVDNEGDYNYAPLGFETPHEQPTGLSSAPETARAGGFQPPALARIADFSTTRVWDKPEPIFSEPAISTQNFSRGIEMTQANPTYRTPTPNIPAMVNRHLEPEIAQSSLSLPTGESPSTPPVQRDFVESQSVPALEHSTATTPAPAPVYTPDNNSVPVDNAGSSFNESQGEPSVATQSSGYLQTTATAPVNTTSGTASVARHTEESTVTAKGSVIARSSETVPETYPENTSQVDRQTTGEASQENIENKGSARGTSGSEIRRTGSFQTPFLARSTEFAEEREWLARASGGEEEQSKGQTYLTPLDMSVAPPSQKQPTTGPETGTPPSTPLQRHLETSITDSTPIANAPVQRQPAESLSVSNSSGQPSYTPAVVSATDAIQTVERSPISPANTGATSGSSQIPVVTPFSNTGITPETISSQVSVPATNITRTISPVNTIPYVSAEASGVTETGFNGSETTGAADLSRPVARSIQRFVEQHGRAGTWVDNLPSLSQNPAFLPQSSNEAGNRDLTVRGSTTALSMVHRITSPSESSSGQPGTAETALPVERGTEETVLSLNNRILPLPDRSENLTPDNGTNVPAQNQVASLAHTLISRAFAPETSSEPATGQEPLAQGYLNRVYLEQDNGTAPDLEVTGIEMSRRETQTAGGNLSETTPAKNNSNALPFFTPAIQRLYELAAHREWGAEFDKTQAEIDTGTFSSPEMTVNTPASKIPASNAVQRTSSDTTSNTATFLPPAVQELNDLTGSRDSLQNFATSPAQENIPTDNRPEMTFNNPARISPASGAIQRALADNTGSGTSANGGLAAGTPGVASYQTGTQEQNTPPGEETLSSASVLAANSSENINVSGQVFPGITSVSATSSVARILENTAGSVEPLQGNPISPIARAMERGRTGEPGGMDLPGYSPSYSLSVPPLVLRKVGDYRPAETVTETGRPADTGMGYSSSTAYTSTGQPATQSGGFFSQGSGNIARQYNAESGTTGNIRQQNNTPVYGVTAFTQVARELAENMWPQETVESNFETLELAHPVSQSPASGSAPSSSGTVARIADDIPEEPAVSQALLNSAPFHVQALQDAATPRLMLHTDLPGMPGSSSPGASPQGTTPVQRLEMNHVQTGDNLSISGNQINSGPGPNLSMSQLNGGIITGIQRQISANPAITQNNLPGPLNIGATGVSGSENAPGTDKTPGSSVGMLHLLRNNPLIGSSNSTDLESSLDAAIGNEQVQRVVMRHLEQPQAVSRSPEPTTTIYRNYQQTSGGGNNGYSSNYVAPAQNTRQDFPIQRVETGETLTSGQTVDYEMPGIQEQSKQKENIELIAREVFRLLKRELLTELERSGNRSGLLRQK